MPSTEVRRNVVAAARLVVVKIGTNVLTGADGRLDRRLIGRLAGQIARHHSAGRRFVVVSSGAIGAGMGELHLPTRPRRLPELQAAAAVGQKHLMNLFSVAFQRHGVHAAQLLLTRADFENRSRYLNIRNSIDALHRFGSIPVINENDVVAVDEIRFGDNDTIAALTTNLLRANLLIVLTVVDGLLDGDGRRIDLIERVTAAVTKLANRNRSSLGSGGMKSKLEAISRVTESGEIAMIANGRMPNVIARILAGEPVGTVFLPAARKMTSRHRWIGMTVRPVGAVHVDAGAARAVVEGRKSLLPSGIVEVEGEFEAGEVISVLGPDGRELARGLSRYDAAEVARIRGCRTSEIAARLGPTAHHGDEVIHRDNLVVLGQ
ncbi:MAG: Glutamate 5-kinase [Phycisphaerae bacterium]|nr:Glutamate 5-kinase [Phycisphaerae bacterium]